MNLCHLTQVETYLFFIMAFLCHKLTSADFAFVQPSEGMISASSAIGSETLDFHQILRIGTKASFSKTFDNSYYRLFSTSFEAKFVSNPSWQTEIPQN